MRKDSTAETTKLKQAISWPDYALAYDGLAYNLPRWIGSQSQRLPAPKHETVNKVVALDSSKLLKLMVARDGIEPPTPAFSGPLTDSLKWSEINRYH